MLTGSYNWFNLLTVLLCLFLFDDQALRRVLPSALAMRLTRSAPRPGRLATGLATALALIVVPIGMNLVYAPLSRSQLARCRRHDRGAGAAAHRQPVRPVRDDDDHAPGHRLEGSDDNQTWREYALPYLPGPVGRAPTWNIPYQPRLDWQLWFAAYGSCGTAAMDRAAAAAAARRQPGRPCPLRGEAVRRGTAEARARAALRLSLRGCEIAGRAAWWVRRLAGTYYPAVSLNDLQAAAPGRPAAVRAKPSAHVCDAIA